jgi:hypothetical protein
MKKNVGEAKPKFLLSVNRQTKLTVQISQKTADLISDYQAFLKKFSAEEMGVDALVNAFISSAITSDKTFTKWRKEKTEPHKETTETQEENNETKI